MFKLKWVHLINSNIKITAGSVWNVGTSINGEVTDISERSQTSYTAPCNGIVSHVGSNWGSLRFLLITHAKTNTKQMHPRSLYVIRCFMCVYLHTQIAVDAGDIRTWWATIILITGKTWRPPIWAPYQDKNGAGSGISLEYLWVKITIPDDTFVCVLQSSKQRYELHAKCNCINFTAVIPCGVVAKFSTGHREARGSILRWVLIFSLSQFSVYLLASASS